MSSSALVLALAAACGDDAGASSPATAAAANSDAPAANGGSGASPSAPATGNTTPSTGASAAGSTSRTGASGQSGSADSPAAAAGASGASADAGTAGTAAPTAGASGAADPGAPAAGGNTPAEATLPPIDDPAAAGPFMVDYVVTAPGLSSHGLFIPSERGTNGKNPIVVWTCGNGGTVSFYQSYLQHLASHGFFVVADKGSSSDRMAEVASQNDAIAWVLAEDAKAGGEYAGTLDVERIAVMGHSLGSLASFATAAMNEHVTTSVHYSGGLTGNPVGFDESWLASMTKPAAFLCGANDSTAGPACEQDFSSAPPMLPVFYATLARADHLGPFAGEPRGGQYGRAGVAWLRWQLAGDLTFKPWFAGASCMLCDDPQWTSMQRNLE